MQSYIVESVYDLGLCDSDAYGVDLKDCEFMLINLDLEKK
jgi:hypothetical protein